MKEQLKPLVNNDMVYKSFLSYVSDEKEAMLKNLSRSVDVNEIFRLQGEIRRLDKFLKLREYVNG